jgi:hypothetical protein
MAEAGNIYHFFDNAQMILKKTHNMFILISWLTRFYGGSKLVHSLRAEGSLGSILFRANDIILK